MKFLPHVFGVFFPFSAVPPRRSLLPSFFCFYDFRITEGFLSYQQAYCFCCEMLVQRLTAKEISPWQHIQRFPVLLNSKITDDRPRSLDELRHIFKMASNEIDSSEVLFNVIAFLSDDILI